MLHLPDDSELKTAIREGDWTADQYVQARIANELMLSRADYASAHGSTMKPTLLLSPAQQADEDEERQAESEIKELFRAQLYGEFIPPPQPGRVFAAETDPERNAQRTTGGGD